MSCEICDFRNPKCSVTAVIIKDNKILTLRRNEEPFKGMLDLPGGYMQEKESPEQALQRELKEELGVDSKLTFIKAFPGNGVWKEKKFPVLNLAYFAEIDGDISLNDENSEIVWLSLEGLNINSIAFDSNRSIAKYCKFRWWFDLDKVKELINQLDSTAIFNESSLYKAILDGHVVKKYDGDKLVGMGWIFPRQTMLRKQCVIEDMIVDDSQRGKGFGKQILNELIEWAKENGVEVIELTTNPKRIAANALYKKIGFTIHPTNHYLYKV